MSLAYSRGMNAPLNTIVPSDDFLWDAMCSNLPKFQMSATQFSNFCCPVCMDYKPRCGIKRSSFIGINCYNCGFAAKYQIGGHLSEKIRIFLSALRVDDMEIKRLNLKALTIRRMMEGSPSPEIRAMAFEPSFKTTQLPLGAAPLMHWVEQGCDEPHFLRAAEYAMSRGTVIFDHANFHWTPIEGFENRVIIPFTWRGNIVGYTARAVDDDKDKYKNFMPSNFLFNATPALENHRREFAILVEGPTDALAIDGVSPLGSKLNEKQTVWLKNSGKRIIVVPDRDKKGQVMINIARKNNWMVSFPHLKSNSQTWWDSDIKDCDEAVKRHGRLYTLKSILECATKNATEIEVKRKYLV